MKPIGAQGPGKTARRWRVEISATHPSMIPVVLNRSSSTWRIYSEADALYLEADLLECHTDVARALEEAQHVLGTVNGYFRTVHPSWQPFLVRGLSRIEDDRPPTQFALPSSLQGITLAFDPILFNESESPSEPQDLGSPHA